MTETIGNIPSNQWDETLKVSKSGRFAFIVEVDGTKTLDQLLDDGNYAWKNSNCNEKSFPISDPTKRTVTIELFHSGIESASMEIISLMKKDDFRPVMIEEFLSLTAQYPELQRKFPMASLGLSWKDLRDYLLAPVATIRGKDRIIDLVPPQYSYWTKKFMFPGMHV